MDSFVDSPFGVFVNVRGPVVTVHAIHGPLQKVFGPVCRPIPVIITMIAAVGLARLYPDHVFPLIINRGIADFVLPAYMPVDAGFFPGFAGIDFQIERGVQELPRRNGGYQWR